MMDIKILASSLLLFLAFQHCSSRKWICRCNANVSYLPYWWLLFFIRTSASAKLWHSLIILISKLRLFIRLDCFKSEFV